MLCVVQNQSNYTKCDKTMQKRKIKFMERGSININKRDYVVWFLANFKIEVKVQGPVTKSFGCLFHIIRRLFPICG